MTTLRVADRRIGAGEDLSPAPLEPQEIDP